MIGNNFPQFDKSQVSALVELLKLRQNLFLSKLFNEDISQYNSFENTNDYLSKHDGKIYNQWNQNTGKRWYGLYLNLSILLRGGTRTPATYKIELFVIVIASSCWLLSQSAASVLDPPMPNARRVEKNIHMVCSCSHR